jgi:polyhydroxybutyrate depolymerase
VIRRRLGVAALLVPLLLAAIVGCAGSGSVDAPRPVPVGNSIRAIPVDGVFRGTIVHRPAGVQGPVPLVLVLHGGFGSASAVQQAYGWDDLADEAGFVVAYPDGAGRSWNAGDCCGAAEAEDVDDVAFLEAVIDDLGAALPVDPRRVYVAGMSNGAMMAYRLACESDRLAAIAAVAGTLVTACPDPAPVSVLAIHGLDDDTVPFEGGPGHGAVEVDGPAVPDVLRRWLAVDECEPPVERSAPAVAESLAECRQGRAVELVTVRDAGHQWPGSERTRAQELLGADPPSTALDATRRIWEFFAAHPAR